MRLYAALSRTLGFRKLKLDISISLDGFVAGLDQTLEEPLGQGGGRLHEWAFATASVRQMHDMEGGDTGVDDGLATETIESAGATIMGRRMFSGGEGPWEDDPNTDAWWGDDPPFHHPVFVLTHHEREPLEKQGGTTFTFGADVAQQYLRAGLLDELQLHVVPVLLGDGVRVFDDHVASPPGDLELTRVAESPTGVTHLRYTVVR